MHVTRKRDYSTPDASNSETEVTVYNMTDTVGRQLLIAAVYMQYSLCGCSCRGRRSQKKSAITLDSELKLVPL